MVYFARTCDEGTQSPNRAPQYVAVDTAGDMIWSEFALADAAGIGLLRARFPEAQVACSPELSQAATAAGFQVAALPEREKKIVAAMAVLVRHSEELAQVELSLVIHLLEALARLQRTERWKKPDAATAFEVVCADLQPHRWVARLIPFQPAMLALMPPGTGYTIEGPSEIDFDASQRVLAVALEEPSGLPRDLLQSAFGLDHAPKLMALFGYRLLTPSPREVALLAATVNALAGHDGGPTALRSHVGGGTKLSLELSVVPPGREPFEGQVHRSEGPPRQLSLREAFEAVAAPQNVPVVSRGAPCPCGSGEKYKRCHGVNAQASGHALPSDTEVHALELRLWELLRPEERALARQGYPVRDADQIEDLAQLYSSWQLYHFRPQATETAAERYLRIHRKDMDARVRTYLEAQRSARVSAWRIRTMAGGWMELEDVLGAGAFRVRSDWLEGAEEVSTGQALLARLFAVPGEVVLSALHPAVIQPELVDQLVGKVQALVSRLGLAADHYAQPEADTTRLLVKPWHEMTMPVKLELVEDER